MPVTGGIKPWRAWVRDTNLTLPPPKFRIA
jgi:hypothetical protein